MNLNDLLLTFAIFMLGLHLQYILLDEKSWYVMLRKKVDELIKEKRERDWEYKSCRYNFKRHLALIIYFIFIAIMLYLSFSWHIIETKYLNDICMAIWLIAWVFIYLSNMAAYPFFRNCLIKKNFMLENEEKYEPIQPITKFSSIIILTFLFILLLIVITLQINGLLSPKYFFITFFINH